MKKLTVRLPDDLWRKVRIIGIQREESMQQMIVRLLRQEVIPKKSPRRRTRPK